ncbi:DJ-1/PfpI family protein [Sulfuriflexus sp.]|uniref:DJ-1/PfpI family protein n=1 Tax=Sulfuriflexus sp. TaxID=2015443 RepID=UPI0028CE4CC1|nr:DJ-1/PfpI family protein [Sulfuriflexus sp.]MDT8404997.1 DJ-1/PfpI family protein [Sulfuriflexus sp.]
MARIAMLAGEGYEDSEFQTPYNRMRNAGHEVIVVGTEKGASVHDKLGTSQVEVRYAADEIQVDDIDAVIIPGGHGPDKLRLASAM